MRSQIVEHTVHPCRNSRIGRQQTDVCIKPRRVGIVVPCAQMRIPPDNAIRIAPDQKRQLAVRLQAHNSVKNLTPASSISRAQRMFEASSKRAVSSTTT